MEDTGVGTSGRADGQTGPRHTGQWTLRTNTVTFFARSRVRLTPDRLELDVPRMLLGLVPFDRIRSVHPLSEIADIRVTTEIHPARLLIAAGLWAAAVAAPLGTVLRIAVIALAFCFFFVGIIKALRLDDRSGGRTSVPVCWLQRGVAAALVRQVDRARAAIESAR